MLLDHLDPAYAVTPCGHGEEALALAGRRPFDAVVLDLRLPDLHGLAVLEHLGDLLPDVPVLIITADRDPQVVIEALRKGAADYILKPFAPLALAVRLQKAIERHDLLNERLGLQRELSREFGDRRFVGASAVARQLRRQSQAAAVSDRPILIVGESGTGKELLAREIHRMRFGEDGAAPFVAVNCGALPEGLAEAELFGVDRGAYSGAERTRVGFFEAANRGTCFLDEAGELSPTTQAKLLRVLDQKAVRRVGATRERPVATRVIAASNRDLWTLVTTGAFRDDLYYRLAVLQLSVPPLRERPDDIPLLTAHLLQRIASRLGRRGLRLGKRAIAALQAYAWPGNVRELSNVLERAVILSSGQDTLSSLEAAIVEVLPRSPRQGASAASLEEAVAQFEIGYIEEVLHSTGGNVSAAARILGIHRTTLYRKLGMA